MNSEKKIIKEMAWGNFKVHKKRNLLLVLAVMLTTILFTSVLEIGFGSVQSIQETQLKLSGMKADAELRYLDADQFRETKESGLFESVGCRIPIAFMDVDTRHPIEIDYFDEEGLEAYYISLEGGSLPKEENEVLMSDKALEELGIKAEEGSQIPVTFTLRDETYHFDMKLSGWYKYDQNSSFLVVSDAFLEKNPRLAEDSYDEDRESAGTYYASVCMEKKGNIEQWLIEYAESLGGQTDDMHGKGYIKVAVNPLAYSEEGNTGIALAIITFGCLFVLCGYLLIYNIFDIGVMQDIQQFGMMKTIGMTQKQIKWLMRRQAVLLSAVGISIGLILGYGLGTLLLPIILKNWEYSEDELVVVQSAHPAIILLTIAFVLITVFFSMRKPSQKAAKYSAIETAKYIEVKGKDAVKDIRSVKEMAKSNIRRNKRRTTLVVTSLMLSIVFVNSFWTISDSFDEEKYINKYMRRDYLIASTDTLNSSIGYVRPSASLNEEAVLELEKSSMVQNGTWLYKNTIDESVYNSNITYDWGIEVLSIDTPNLEFDGVITNNATTNYGRMTLSEDGKAVCNVWGITENFVEKMRIWDGEKDPDVIKEKLKSGNYILAAVWEDDYGNPSKVQLPDLMDVGEKITIYKDGKPVREVEILSQIIVNNSERITGTNVTGDNIISGPSFYLGESLFKELYGSSTLVNYSFDANPEDAQSVNEMLNRITQEYPDVGFETVEQRREEIGNYKMLVRIICLLIGGILGVIGLVNLINIIFTNLIIRNRELATLRSIGATKKQLRELIIRESIWYVLYAAMGGVLLSTVINVTVIREICDTMWVLTFRFTLYPAVVIVVLFLLIAITASVAGIFSMEKRSITERLRCV